MVVIGSPGGAKMNNGALNMPKRNMLKVVLLILMIFLAAGGGTYYLQQHRSSNNTQSVSETYRYSSTKTTKFAGPAADSGLIFDLPKEFAASPTSTHDKKAAEHNSYRHTLEKNKSQRVLSFAYVSSIISSSPPKASAGLVKTSLQSRFPNLQISVSHPQTFQNQNIKTKAWEFGFTAFNTKDNASSAINGEFVYIIGAKSYYYFMIAAIQANWQANQQTWHGVLDSLKIDQ